jgi:transcriptional regulator with XRE-family HTH domain
VYLRLKFERQRRGLTQQEIARRTRIEQTVISANLRHNPAVALVIGSAAAGSTRTVQLEGVTDEPEGADLTRLLELYFARFPEGRARQNWSGITYLRVTSTWLRYSDFSVDPPEIVEFQARDLT